jgi:Tol biopolymer transport system component
MLTGEAAFQGETLAEVVAGVMKGEPNWDRLPPDTPAAVRRVLQRCLQKDYRRRLQCIGDARLELTDIPSPSGVERIPASAVQRRERIAWIAFAAAAIVAAVIGVYALRPASRSPEMRLDIVTPPSADPTTFALSPDGLQLAFAGDSGNPVLWLRALGSGQVRALPGTDNAEFPFWSADSRSLGFFAGGKLKRIDIDTGLIRVLADAAGRGGAWNHDGIILFAPGANTPIFKMSSDGGQTTPVTRLKGQQGTHRQPHFLPDGRHFLFWGQDGGIETRAVYAGDIDGSEPKLIVNSDVSAEFSPAGQLIFFRDNKLFAQPFDPAQLSLTGSPTLLADQVLFTPGYNVAALSASAAGPIAYRTGAPATKRLVWIDRNTGKETEAVGNADQASPMGVSLSPDGRRVALARTLSGNIDVWLLETARGVLSRFTSDPSRQRWPLWSPDGGRIAFGSNLKGTYDLYQNPPTETAPKNCFLPRHNRKVPRTGRLTVRSFFSGVRTRKPVTTCGPCRSRNPERRFRWCGLILKMAAASSRRTGNGSHSSLTSPAGFKFTRSRFLVLESRLRSL